MNIPLLNDILVIFGLSIFIILIFHRFKIPTIVGLLLTGILVGPHGFGLVNEVNEVEILAEIGVTLLLFTIGIEFSFRNLLQLKKAVLLGGSLQVFLIIFIVLGIAKMFEIPLNKAIFIGFLIPNSSTAIVLKLFQEKAEVDSPHGRTSLAISIFQDIVSIPMLLSIPILAGISQNSPQSISILIVKIIGIALLVMVSTKWIVPKALYQITKTRNRELFLLTIVSICFAVAWLTSSVGLSLAFGAFLAGLIISESEYSHQALGNILPFRDIFTSFFFISIGMLLNVQYIIHQPLVIILITISVLTLKTIITGFSVGMLGLPIRTIILVGLALCQISEFSFVLANTGLKYDLIDKNAYQLFLAVSILTMIATPFIINVSPNVANFFLKLPLPKKLKSGLDSNNKAKDKLNDHLVIIGFGINGRNVARSAKASDIPYIIIEMNPETVKNEYSKGEPIYYGDATQEVVLNHANIKQARVVVIGISDNTATGKIISAIRRLNPKVHIIVRTRFFKDAEALYELGADEVIPEEFETSIEIFTRVLAKYLIPKDEIEKFVNEIRADGYEMLRSLSILPASFYNLKTNLANIEISTLKIDENSFASGKSLADIELRKKYGITLLAINRDSQIISNPGGDTKLHPNDIVFVMGNPDKITKVVEIFHKKYTASGYKLNI